MFKVVILATFVGNALRARERPYTVNIPPIYNLLYTRRYNHNSCILRACLIGTTVPKKTWSRESSRPGESTGNGPLVVPD